MVQTINSVWSLQHINEASRTSIDDSLSKTQYQRRSGLSSRTWYIISQQAASCCFDFISTIINVIIIIIFNCLCSHRNHDDNYRYQQLFYNCSATMQQLEIHCNHSTVDMFISWLHLNWTDKMKWPAAVHHNEKVSQVMGAGNVEWTPKNCLCMGQRRHINWV